MALEIRLTPAARGDLTQVHRWSADNFGEAQADAYAGELFRASVQSRILRKMRPKFARD